MSKYKKLFLLGYSGHAYMVLDVALANNYEVEGYFDKKIAVNDPYGLSYLGDEDKVDFRKIVEGGYVFPAMGSNSIRKKLLTFVEKQSARETKLVASTAAVSDLARIGESSVIGPNAIVNSQAIIGKGCIVNSGAIVEHECIVGDFSHIAPGTVLTGNVVVGANTFIGAGAVVKQGLTIGDNVTVGAGAVVLKNIPKGEVWVGNPAKRLN